MSMGGPLVGMDLSLSDSQEILCLEWHAYVHYLIHKQPSQIPVQSQINPSTSLHISFKLAVSSARFFIFLPAHPVCYFPLFGEEHKWWSYLSTHLLLLEFKFQDNWNLVIYLKAKMKSKSTTFQW
jgi:hypothetical protein